MVEITSVCKISDFGFSKLTDDINEQKLQNDEDVLTALQGTVFWMAPEVVNTGKRGYNSKVDIWSLGCVVLEMWTGERPWHKEEAMDVVMKVRRRFIFLCIRTFERCAWLAVFFQASSSRSSGHYAFSSS